MQSGARLIEMERVAAFLGAGIAAPVRRRGKPFSAGERRLHAIDFAPGRTSSARKLMRAQRNLSRVLAAEKAAS